MNGKIVEPMELRQYQFTSGRNTGQGMLSDWLLLAALWIALHRLQATP